MTTATTEPSSASAAWLQRGFLAAMLLACAVALSPSTVDPDVWGHVQYAEDALAEGRLHRTATHTFTAEGYRWINHENLMEFALALGFRHLGIQGMLVGKCLLGLAVMGLMIRAARRSGVDFPVVCAFLLLVATTLTAFWAMRPQLASYVLLALMVVALDQAFVGWRDHRQVRFGWLWTLPPLFLVWANAHGAFVAGVCLLAAYLGLRGVEALWSRGRAAIPTVLYLAAIVLAAAAATLATPYGLELHKWLIASLGTPRPEISEWGPPTWDDPFFVPFAILLAVTIAAWVFTARRRDWTHIALISLCTWQAISHSRHIALFAVLAGYWLPEHVQSVVDRVRASRRKAVGKVGANTSADDPPPRWLYAGLALALLLLVGRLGLRLWDFPVEKDKYPVEAVRFMAENDLTGRLVVSFNWAQYALAALSPDVEVAFDGRFRTCYPQEVIDMHFDFLVGEGRGKRYRNPRSGPIDGTRVLEHGQPNLVLVDRRFEHSARVMTAQENFVLLYQDALAQVWGRDTVYDDPAKTTFFAETRRRITEEPQVGTVSWPALPEKQTFAPLVNRVTQPPAVSASNGSTTSQLN